MRLEISHPGVIGEIVDGEVVAINLETGHYYSIRGSGADIWGAIEHGASLDDIVAWLASGNGGDSGTIRAEATRFVDALRDEGLLRPGPDGNGAGALVAPSARSFETPVVEKFTDMEDLLLLDPVHEVDSLGWPHAPTG